MTEKIKKILSRYSTKKNLNVVDKSKVLKKNIRMKIKIMVTQKILNDMKDKYVEENIYLEEEKRNKVIVEGEEYKKIFTYFHRILEHVISSDL